MKIEKDRFLDQGETGVFVTKELQKTASLLFDKIYLGVGVEHNEDDIPLELTFGDLKTQDEGKKSMHEYIDCFRKSLEANTSILRSSPDIVVEISKIYHSRGHDVLPLHSHEKKYENEYSKGSNIAYEVAFNNLPLLKESTPWEQISEFRRDKEALRKYRAFRTWLREVDCSNGPVAVNDSISLAYDDYLWSLKKHGVETYLSTLKCLVNPKLWFTAAGVAGSVGIISSSPVLSGLAGGVVVASQVGVVLSEKRLQIENARRNELAYLQMVENNFKSNK